MARMNSGRHRSGFHASFSCCVHVATMVAEPRPGLATPRPIYRPADSSIDSLATT